MTNKIQKIKSAEKWYWIALLKIFLALPLYKRRKILKYVDYRTNFRIHYLFEPSEFDKLKEDFTAFKTKGVPATGSYHCDTLIGEPMRLNLTFNEIYDIGS